MILFALTIVVTLAIIGEFGILIGEMPGLESTKGNREPKSSQVMYKSLCIAPL